MCGAIEFGKCEICGKEKPLTRTYFHYGIKCECHAPEHFESVRHCEDCAPKEPMKTKITISTEKLKNSIMIDADKFEHLLNCMRNQKFIHEQNKETQKEWQKIIDEAYHEARIFLSTGMLKRRD